jgi:hypothetical protein
MLQLHVFLTMRSHAWSSYQIIMLRLHVFLATEVTELFIISLCFSCSYFWQHEVTELFVISMCFGSTYFWQREVTELFYITMYIEIEMDAGGLCDC